MNVVCKRNIERGLTDTRGSKEQTYLSLVSKSDTGNSQAEWVNCHLVGLVDGKCQENVKIDIKYLYKRKLIPFLNTFFVQITLIADTSTTNQKMNRR